MKPDRQVPPSLLDEDDPLKNDSPPRPARPGRRGPRRWLRVLLVLLLLPLLLAGLAPRLASTGAVRRLVLGKVNARIAPASLAVDDWTFRWFGPMRISGLRYTDPARGAGVQAVGIAFSNGLAAMLPIGTADLGTVTIEAPQAVLRLPARAAAPAAEEAPPAAQPRPPSLPATDVAVRLLVHGGRLEIATDDPRPFVLEHAALDVQIASLRKPVAVTCGAFVPWADDAGRLAVQGSLPAPASLLGEAEQTPEKLEITVAALDLQSFRSLLAGLSGHPWVQSGVADGRVQAAYRGRDSAQVQAGLKIARLSVAPPGRPVSPAGDVNVEADVALADGRLTINRLACASPWVGLRADGQFALQPDANGRRLGGMAAALEADLPAITRDFGSLLGLRPDLRAEQGRLHADATLAGTADGIEARVGLVTSNLALRAGGELFAFQPAPAARLNISKPYDGPPEVRELLADFPFAHVSGKGRVEQADFRAAVDLDALTKELRRVAANCPPMSGTIEATVKTAPAAGGRVALDAAVSAAGISADLGGNRRVALQRARITAAAAVPLVNGLPGREAAGVKVLFDGDAGTISASADRIVAPAGTGRPLLVAGGQARIELDLAAARRLAQPLLAFLPPTASVAGRLTANATAEAGGGVLKARLSAAAQDVQFASTAWDARERDVRLRVSADLDDGKGTLRVFDTRFASQLASLDVPELLVQRTPGGAPALRGGATGEVNLAVLAAWMKPGRDGKPPPRLQGRVTFRAQGTTDSRGASLSLSAAADQVRVAVADNQPFEEAHAELALVAALPAEGDRLALETLALKTSLAEFSAKGRVDDLKRSRQADLSGALALDFDSLTRLLRAQGVRAVTLSGRQSRPFALTGPLGGNPKQILSYGRASAAAYVGSVAALGLAAGPADASLRLDKGVAAVAYEPAVSQGRVSLTPSVQVTLDPMVLTLPAGARVMQGVPLTQELLDQGLWVALPLLRGSASASGLVDLTMQECRVPLGATLKRDLTFEAALSLRNLRLAPAGALATVLNVAGYGGQEVTIEKYDLTSTCKDGRVRNSPLKLKVAGTTVTLSGSVGLDGTLAYTAEVPLSRGLVGAQAAKYLADATVRVPITGTAKAPAIDRKAMESEIGRLVQQAVEKAALGGLGDLLKGLPRR
jgi:hypothetical protein